MSSWVISTAVLRPSDFMLVWLASESQRFTCLQFLSARIASMCHYTLLLSHGFWGVSSSLWICVSMLLPTEPSLQPTNSIFLSYNWINSSCSTSVVFEPSADWDVPTDSSFTKLISFGTPKQQTIKLELIKLEQYWQTIRLKIYTNRMFSYSWYHLENLKNLYMDIFIWHIMYIMNQIYIYVWRYTYICIQTHMC